MKWYYQTTWRQLGRIAVQDMALAEMEIDGEMKKVLLHAKERFFLCD